MTPSELLKIKLNSMVNLEDLLEKEKRENFELDKKLKKLQSEMGSSQTNSCLKIVHHK